MGKKQITQEELAKILTDHVLWLADPRKKAGKRADLVGADLRYANLSGAFLQSADLSHTNLTGTDLRDANLSRVNLDEAIIKNTKF